MKALTKVLWLGVFCVILNVIGGQKLFPAAEKRTVRINEAEPVTETIGEKLKGKETEPVAEPAEVKVEGMTWELAKVVYVIDGDTLIAETGGTEHKVRFSGLNTPESVASDEYLSRTGKTNSEFGKASSAFTKALLKENQYVWLVRFDGEPDEDAYGRKLRTIWLEIPDNPYAEEELKAKCLNAMILNEGYAECLFIDTATQYRYKYTKMQTEAMDDRRGLWADESYWEYTGMI